MADGYPSEVVRSSLARIDWVPVRGVPAALDDAVEHAEGSFLLALRASGGNRFDEAADEWRQILDRPEAAGPPPFREDGLNRAAVATWYRGEARADVADLDRAIGLLEAALAIATQPENRARYLHNMGQILHACSAWRDDPDALDRAIELGGRAIDEAPRARLRPMFAIGEASHLAARFDQRGSIDDLDEAIRLSRLGLRLARSPLLKEASHETLGMVYRRRYTRTRDRRDIDLGVRHLRTALDLTLAQPDAAAESVAIRQTNFGNALLDRFALAGRRRDLEEAIAAQRRAVELSQEQARFYPHRLNNLANTYSSAYEATNDGEWLDQAIEAYRASLARTSDTSAERPSRQYNLANALAERYGRAHARSDLRAATGAYRAAAAGGDQSLEWALGASRRWSSWAAQRGAWREASEATDHGLAALAMLVRTQVTRTQKQSWIRDTRGMPARSAYAKAKAGDLEGAVEAAESARALLMSEALDRDHADLARLIAEGHPGYAASYRKARGQLEIARRIANPDGAEGDGRARSRPDGMAMVRGAQASLEVVVERIRRLPGHADFLLAPRFADIVADAGDTPLVYLGAAERGGIAVAVLPGGSARVAWLPGLTETSLAERVAVYREAYAAFLEADGVRELRGPWEAAIDDTTGWLGRTVMAGVLRLVRGHSRVTLVPAGLLGVLPLHAAWTPRAGGAGRRYVLDRVVVRYAANARAHAIARSAAAGAHTDHLFAVDQPDLGSHSTAGPLAFSSAEVGVALAAFPEHEVLGGRSARCARVAGGLQRGDVLHLSCHGRAEPDRPLDSALAMAGGDALSVRDVLGRRLRARLTILSACETAIPGDDLPDEVIGFTSGFVQAGSAAAIATLWSVPSFATALLLTRFYAAWRVESCDPSEALAVAQRWLRDTTNDMKASFVEQLLPGSGHPLATSAVRDLYRALVLDPRAVPDARDHASPFNWAAFTYVGA